jgi:hypothetical protein
MPRIYDGNATWDIGYLFFRSDRLCYCGEETRFALRQNQITAIRLGDGTPSLLPSKRIFVAWKDEERNACGVFNVSCGNANSTFHANRLTADLATRLQAWWKTAPVTRPLPAQLAELSAPQIRAITSQSLCARWTSKKVFNELTWTGIFTAVGASLCGLPFHFTLFLINLANPALYSNIALERHVSPPGAGWFAVTVAVAIRFLTLLPLLRYRETPQLVADTLPKRHITPPPPAPTKTNPADKERVPAF